jgi:pilus assembly protein CpaF
MQDLFEFEQTGIQDGRVMGALKSTGLPPRFSEKFALNNINLPANIFDSNAEL